jgi:alanyl-tRNA synthetase
MSSPQFSVADIRKTFLDFFVSKGHTIVESSSLVPGNDPTLMFTNSGMVQFKDVFLGTDKRPYVRATSVQACLRAGGKHNDLENVGYTARHHTFFEMLGNWSFGDYFKKESLMWAWELLTQVYKLPADRLWVTVYFEDQQAYDIWTKDIGVPNERVIRIGDNKGARYASDNFWMMADTGPCGPCSEIFYDHGPEVAGGPPGSPEQDGDRFIEIWNNVFMQFDMQVDGSLKNLPAPCVDTGMGLERLAAIMQGVHSNYEIDLFERLIKASARETGCSDLNNNSLKVIADHIRATCFLVCDGVTPSNEGRGYVQRRIVRRAIRHGYKLGKKTPFFHKLVPDLVSLMGEAYPMLKNNQERVMQVLKAEEERFYETLEIGMQILDQALEGDSQILAGDVAFKLHDTYGFPLDLSNDVCRERGLTVDESGFNDAMERQKSQARAAGKFKMDRALEYTAAPNEFVGYDLDKCVSQVLAIFVDGLSVPKIREGQIGIIVLDKTPFYAESGGQVGDVGMLSSAQSTFTVTDTSKIKADVFGHHGLQSKGDLSVGDKVDANIDLTVRKAIMRHHSVTHLMHKALRQVLGPHVQQKGSLVNSERTRFDFAHNAPLSSLQMKQIETIVNDEILHNSENSAQSMDIESAKKTGAMMLFGEKYGDTVRVLEIGSSRELCGGTHVKRTGDIGLFKIVGESGVASGVRRIEAVAGEQVLHHLQHLETTLETASSALKAPVGEINAKILQIIDQSKSLEKELDSLKGKLASSQGNDLVSSAVSIGEVKLISATLPGGDAKMLRDTLDQLRNKLKSCVVVLASAQGGKVQLVAGVSSDLTSRVKAGELVNFVALQVGGKGGGKADMAMAGGTQPEHLDSALMSVRAHLEKLLSF